MPHPITRIRTRLVAELARVRTIRHRSRCVHSLDGTPCAREFAHTGPHLAKHRTTGQLLIEVQDPRPAP